MIKGSIENVSTEYATGWIYSEARSLRDATVLAFSGERCIGAGTVNTFRQDLANAGLGDGYLGFHFPISLPDGMEPASVVVRLDNAEAVLLQRGSRVTGAEAATRAKEPSPEDVLQQLRWLRRRNSITASEYEFLRGLTRFGVYELPLDVAVPGAAVTGADIAACAQKMLELSILNEITLDIACADDGDDMRRKIESVRAAEDRLTHIGIWSPVPARIGVVEGGHLDKAATTDAAGAVDYHLDPSSILIFHSRCAISLRPGVSYDGIQILSGVTKKALAEARAGH
jgi:hypothetical protein